MKTYKHCGIALMFAILGCAPLNGAGPNSKTFQQPQMLAPSVVSTSWAGRSGRAEALADIAAGRPVKLFYQSLFGEREFVHTPGLSKCSPDRYDVPDEARSQFEPIGADYSESIQYTEEEIDRFRSATQFARAYNIAMLTMKRDEVLRICPAATSE